ncbi:MAG: FAD-dependent oxidoreductase [Klebsiella quasipneumoniae]|nr:FAD-dependent oxidoreductase [Klebsiella quasipneumoniae]
MFRRQLISCAVAGVFAATVSMPAFATQYLETDLVIVGGGLSGLAAAQSAVDQGVKPIVLEKEPALGGGGNFPEGSLGVGTRYQKEHGITTTVDQVLTAALQFHHYRADPAVLRVLIEESGKTVDWVIDKGAQMRGIRTMYPPEETLNTWHLFKGGAAGIIQRFAKEIRAKGGTILTETPAKKLITENGKVVGVEAVDGEGEKVIVKAKKVILATGGFESNKEMLAKYVPDSSALGMFEPVWYRGPVTDGKNGDGRTGDGINMAQLVGAGVKGMHAIAGNAPYLADLPPINQFMGADELKQGRCALAQPWLWVDQHGKRFFNESRGSVFVDVYNAMTTAGGVMYNIIDQQKYDQLVNKGALLPFNAIVLAGVPLKALPKTFEIGQQRGWAFKANTIDDLAAQIGVPAANLRETIKKVNEYAKAGKDPEFGRNPEHLATFDMEKGPYYALKGIRAFFLTLGGVSVTPQFEALTPQGDVIPNLYVSGQDIGGLYDSSYDLRCEGSASSFAMTSGRLAADNAIKAIKESK